MFLNNPLTYAINWNNIQLNYIEFNMFRKEFIIEQAKETAKILEEMG